MRDKEKTVGEWGLDCDGGEVVLSVVDDFRLAGAN